MIVDAHVHIFPPEVVRGRHSFLRGEPAFELLYADPAARLADLDGLIQVMDEDGIEAAAVCGFPWTDPGRARLHNDYVLEAANRHPGRIIPLAAVDILSPGAVEEAGRALAAGAAGLGELAVYGGYPADPGIRSALLRLAGLCAEADRPLLLHANEPVGHAYPGKSPMTLKGLYDLIKASPKTRFQLAHLGGGIFFFELMKKEVGEVLADCVYDTAAAPYLYRPEIYPVFRQIAGPGRLLFGSDFPLLRLGRYLKDLDQAEIDFADREAILGGNAREFWGLNRK